MKPLAAAICVLVPLGAARADDAISRYDNAIISSEIMEECHLVITGRLDNDKLHAAGNAAFVQLGGQPGDRGSGRGNENDEKADFALKKRTEADLVHGRELVADKGCATLGPHAREVLESYRQ